MATKKILSNRYHLQERIGVGGFSEVWKAQDTETQQTVGIKLFLRQDAQSIVLFESEFKRMQGFNHPNILKPKTFGIDDDLPYFVMTYCAKGTLINRIGRLNELQIAELIAQISAALAYIHDRGIVHKDIKPDNILIYDDGSYLLTDFGISEELEQRFTKSIDLAKAVEGTNNKNKVPVGIAPMAYRPPESFNFKDFFAEKETAPCDIWALGAMTYQMACKNLPFEEAGGFQQLIAAAAQNFSVNDLVQELPSQYSRNLDKILKLCLDFDKESRPTATTLQQLAETYLKEGYWNFKETKAKSYSSVQEKQAINKKVKPVEHTNTTPKLDNLAQIEELKYTVEKLKRKSNILIGGIVAVVAIAALTGLLASSPKQIIDSPLIIEAQKAETRVDSLLLSSIYPSLSYKTNDFKIISAKYDELVDKHCKELMRLKFEVIPAIRNGDLTSDKVNVQINQAEIGLNNFFITYPALKQGR
jgi:serine/threonine protein kinase